jgi:2-polyprenyl-3-methyl-5-hydroxy-6-metoxy-1,4-benzoquinol methylase
MPEVEDRSKHTTPEYFYREFVERLPENGRVLDAGCGTGYLSNKLIEDGFEVVSVDVNEDRIEKGKELGRFEDVRVADVQDLEFENKSFEGIISVEVIEHLPKPEKFIKEANRLLKPEGVLAIKTPQRPTHDLFQIVINKEYQLLKGEKLDFHPNVMSPRTLIALLDNNGFETDYIKANSMPKNQIKKLGFLSALFRPIEFHYLPKLFQPTNMVISRNEE